MCASSIIVTHRACTARLRVQLSSNVRLQMETLQCSNRASACRREPNSHEKTSPNYQVPSEETMCLSSCTRSSTAGGVVRQSYANHRLGMVSVLRGQQPGSAHIVVLPVAAAQSFSRVGASRRRAAPGSQSVTRFASVSASAHHGHQRHGLAAKAASRSGLPSQRVAHQTHNTLQPNPSLKLTRYGMRCKPGVCQFYHRHTPGLQHMPPRAA